MSRQDYDHVRMFISFHYTILIIIICIQHLEEYIQRKY